jgi:hypothetical protein
LYLKNKNDSKNGAIATGSAIKQFSQDPIDTVKYGVIGSGQSFIENVSNLADGWKWLLTSKPETAIDSGKQFFGDLAAKEKAKMEENPGAYAFRGARDLYITLATSLFGGSSSTLSKTAGAADKIDDAAKLVNKVENVADDVVKPSSQINPKEALPPTKNVESTGKNVGAIDDTKTVQSSSQNPGSNKGGIENLLGDSNRQLIEDLTQQGIKFTPENIVGIGKTQAGKTVFLETGSSKSGLKHIIADHSADFARKGISESQIPDAVIKAVTEGKVVGIQGKRGDRVIYEVNFNGQTQRIAVTVGDNGYIVGANPSTK